MSVTSFLSGASVVPNAIVGPFSQVLSNRLLIPTVSEGQDNSLAANFFNGAGVNTTFRPASRGEITRAIRSIDERFKELESKENQAEKLGFTFQNLSVLHQPEKDWLRATKTHFYLANMGFPIAVDMSFLELSQDGSGYPMFGVLPMDKPTFMMTVTRGRSGSDFWVEFNPILHPDLHPYFSNHAQHLSHKASRGESVFISSTFSGEMPQKLVDFVIKCYNSRLFDSIDVYFEGKWKLNTREIPVSDDPLIIGRSCFKDCRPHYTLLGMFNPTKNELFVADNYTR